jgi:hypothetical protein
MGAKRRLMSFEEFLGGWPAAERSDAPELCDLGLRKLSHQPPNSSKSIITKIATQLTNCKGISTLGRFPCNNCRPLRIGDRFRAENSLRDCGMRESNASFQQPRAIHTDRDRRLIAHGSPKKKNVQRENSQPSGSSCPQTEATHVLPKMQHGTANARSLSQLRLLHGADRR